MSHARKHNVGTDDKKEAKRGSAAPPPAKPATPRPEVDSVDATDPVDQASYDSFPASDPPAHSSNRAIPGAKRDT